MEKLILHMYESGKSKQDKIVTIPLSQLEIAPYLMPTKMKAVLQGEGIDINILSDLSGKAQEIPYLN